MRDPALHASRRSYSKSGRGQELRNPWLNEATHWTETLAVAKLPALEGMEVKESPLYTFTSHIEGKNAKVSIYPDRIDWIRPRGVSGGKVTAGVLTSGLSLLATGVRKNSGSGTEMIPVKSISSVVTSREGILYDKVSVITTGNTIDFRVSHSDAAKVKQILNQLIRGAHPAQQPGQSQPVSQVTPASQSDVMEQLAKLGELKAAGVITEEEFQSKKTELLGRL